jgi:hypothetical protein
MPVVFDIAAKLVSPDQQIWTIFPGLGRRYFGRFHDEGVIFLEMPGINLTPRALEDDEVLRQHVAMSLAFIKYYRGGTGSPPSRRPESYDPPKNARSAPLSAMSAVCLFECNPAIWY